jgi:hypothetical protein
LMPLQRGSSLPLKTLSLGTPLPGGGIHTI